jgi:putative pyruvate formate lyase activating enzyme
LSSCNLGCIYCQNYQISQTTNGQELTDQQLAQVMLDLQNRGCHNVEPVTPTPQTPQIMEALVLARERGLKIPFVYNCGGYENPKVIRMLNGMVEIYLPDFKYGLEDEAVEYSAAPGYPVFALDSLKEMARQVGDELETEKGVAKRGIIVRHLVLPGNIENSKEVFRLIKKNISVNVPVSLMSQYSPMPKVRCHPLLSRRITRDEYSHVLDYALKLGFKNLFIQEVSECKLIPDFDRKNPFE